MSQEIENNFEERKKDWDLTGLLDDVIRRYIYQLTNDELNEINFLDILDERGVNYSVLPDLKYGDNHIQIAVANQSLQQFAAAIKAYLEEFPDAAKDLVEDITEIVYNLRILLIKK